MNIDQYLDAVNKHYRSGHATEHSYRGDFAELIKSIVPDVHITNEPSNVTDCGNPDYVLTKKKIPVGFIEAKDVGKDLNSKQYKEQFDRYKKALDNLIITDYVWFQFFERGVLTHEIRIAEVVSGKIKPIPEKFTEFTNLIQNFCTYISQTIKSPKVLAEMMAAKARLLENILEKAITSDEKKSENTELQEQYETFKSILIHDLTPQGFADIYAQTLAYGMFAARLHDKTLDTFSRQEAADLIPKTNPFLRRLFEHLAGASIDERIVTTVDNLADVFRATNVDELLKNFGKSTQAHDPIIHFYETFLSEYDPKLRKARGVWYTPEPVVKFIVHGVDDILKKEFGLKDGLADTSKTVIEVEAQGTSVTKGKGKGKSLIEKKEVHRVQVLDPATGTGTFLAEVIKYIYSKKFTSMQGAWSNYVDEHLIPRLNGFELLMASYSMAHLKLDMLLTETGYKGTSNQRFNIFLTNSLEEYHPDTGTLFSSWLSSEANEANKIKRDSPIMVVLGNPPYSINSSNKGGWILDLISIYKKGLNEKKINLDDDYIKFIRYGQYFIEKNGEGILAFITNNSFIDGITHREMRRQLMITFDKIFILDLHGNSKKQEKSPDGSVDENVFDITQGVSVNLFIKKSIRSSHTCEVNHFDLYGERSKKYDYVSKNTIESIPWNTIKPVDPYLFFVPKDFSEESGYEKGFSISDLFLESNTGIQTKRDKFVYAFTEQELQERLVSLSNDSSEVVRVKFNLPSDGRDWSVDWAKADIINNQGQTLPVHYHPFDERVTFYTGKTKGFMAYPRAPLMDSMIGNNLALLSVRNSRRGNVNSYFVSDKILDKDAISPFDNCKFFPLYINEEGVLEEGKKLKLNLNQDIVNRFSKLINLSFSIVEVEEQCSFSPFDLFDYIYAILYSISYRNKYSEFLKIDFPKIPYPTSEQSFWKFVGLGKNLRELHLLKSNKLENFISTYPVNGNNEISNDIVKKDWELYDFENKIGRIWINQEQYFDGIPLSVWELYIGGYQPAQKWLKDRKERVLTFEEIEHYQKIIVSLHETIRIMKDIEKLEF